MKHSHMTSDTRWFGVLGDPIRQSKSPLMMNRAFAEVGYAGVYGAFQVHSNQLGAAIDGLRALKYKGANVTIPHKVDVMAYLDEIDPDAQAIGAVNTIVERDGKLFGYNTDGIGYVRSLLEETNVELSGRRIVILGAGGAAKGIAYALAKHQPQHILIINRTLERAVELANQLKALAPCTGVDETHAGLRNELSEAALIVNTTSVGMHPNVGECPINTDWLPNHTNTVVSDLIYNPLKTKLLIEAEARGLQIHGGLGMFIYQGAYAFEYWTGLQAPTAVMREEVLKSLQAVE